MLDINLIRKDPEFVKAALAKREYEVDFTELLQWDARRKEIIAEGGAQPHQQGDPAPEEGRRRCCCRHGADEGIR